MDDVSWCHPALYAAGNFTHAGNVAARHIARWDGSGWSRIGSGVVGGVAGGVTEMVADIAVFDDGSASRPALYVAGDFDSAGGVPAQSIARWDGEEWSSLGGGVDGGVMSLQVFDSGAGAAIHAAGVFSHAGDVEAESIARWDGDAWAPLEKGVDGIIFATEVFDDGVGPKLYAGGDFDHAGGEPASNIAAWDGQSWSALGTGVYYEGASVHFASVYALAVHDDGAGPALYVGGRSNLPAACPWTASPGGAVARTI